MTFLEEAWTQHAENPREVAERLKKNRDPLTAAGVMQLLTHVLGEHLGQWSEGIDALGAFPPSPDRERLIAVLELARADKDLSAFSSSDKIRVLAMASTALAGPGAPDVQRARELFNRAQLACGGLDAKDPANRALAINGNNLACTLEERPLRTREETELMIEAAKSARHFWDIAGGWMEVERAEYRLASSYLAAGQPQDAKKHAEACLRICLENGADDFELKYAREINERVTRAC